MDRREALPIIDRLLAWSLKRPLSPVPRYLTASLLVILAALIRVALITNLLPWLIFMPVVLLIGLTMGKRTGLYAVVLSAVLAAITIAHPGPLFWLTGPQWGASFMFVAIAASQVYVAAELRNAFIRARRLVDEREAANAQLLAKEEQSQLLNHELGHRLKNLLTIVQAIVSQTIRQAPDLASAGDALGFRLAAFGRAADVLTASQWEAADIHALAKGALAGHGSMEERFHLSGPPVRIQPQIALALALAFHELATNAVKYGALSNDTGRVNLEWSIEPGPNPAEPRFCLTWQELGGPVVQPPAHRGFGSLMIERSLRSYFRGATSMRFEPGGLIFRIDAPLAGAQAEDSA